MPFSDTTERGLERLICTAMTGHPCDPIPTGQVRERPAAYGTGWIGGDPHDYDREYCVDLFQLGSFLRETQPEVAESLDLESDGGKGLKIKRYKRLGFMLNWIPNKKKLRRA